mgnify:CR=1 FL=1
MKRKRIPFYRKDPFLKTVGWAGYGLAPWLAPAVVPASMMDGTAAMATSAVLYGTMATAYVFPRTRKYVIDLCREHWQYFKRHLGARHVSRVIRETLFNAGLVVIEIREVTDRRGKIRRKEIVHYPETDIQVDETNIYIRFNMLPGQTTQEWERKVEAFAHALSCGLVSSNIGRGTVDLTLQFAELAAPDVPYKTDASHSITLGYTSAGPLMWEFDTHPHGLVVGPTGTGKSTFLRNLLIQMQKDWIVKIADGKVVEFSYLKNFGYDVVDNVEGFQKMVEEAQREVDRRFRVMQKARKNHYSDIGEKPYFLIIDEAIYFLESLPTKKDKGTGISERDRTLALLRDISLRGRAAGVQLIMIFQRPDGAILPTIIRDNLTAKVVLGGSIIAFEMAFGSDKAKGLDPVKLGHGYASISDGSIELFRFPEYTQAKFLDDLENSSGRPVTDESTETEPLRSLELSRQSPGTDRRAKVNRTL